MHLKEFADKANGLVGSERATLAGFAGVELRVEDRATGEYYKIDELAVDTERHTLFLVVNSDREGERS